MTKKARRRLAGLLMPRRSDRSMAVASDYARHPLDLRLEEVMPEGVGRGNYRRREVLDLSSNKPVVKPGVLADDEFHVKHKKVMARASLLSGLNLLIDAALAGAGAIDDEGDSHLVVLSDRAGLTLAEYEASTMRANGLKWVDIAKAQGVSPSTSRAAAMRGLAKLRNCILNCD